MGEWMVLTGWKSFVGRKEGRGRSQAVRTAVACEKPAVKGGCAAAFCSLLVGMVMLKGLV